MGGEGPSLSRNAFLDYAKGVLIWMVVFGHSIQFMGYTNGHYWEDPLFKLVYMFHMPLFIGISGYLSGFSISRTPIFELLRRRFLQLILPIFCWSTLFCIVRLCMDVKLHLINIGGAMLALPGDIFEKAINGFWFLWVLYLAIAVFVILHRVGLDKRFAPIVLLILIITLPDISFLSRVKYLLPFFGIGYMASVCNWSRISDVGILIAIAFMGICFHFWNRETYIYNTGMSLFTGHVGVVIFRYVASGFASIAVLGVLWWAFRQKFILGFVSAGRNSFLIYIFQVFVMDAIIFAKSHFSLPLENSVWFAVFIAPIVATLIVLACGVLERILSTFSFTRIVFLGGRA